MAESALEPASLLLPILFGVGLEVVLVLVLTWLAWRAAVRQGTAIWQRLMWLPLVGGAAVLLGLAGTMLPLTWVIQGVAGVAPAEKATTLAGALRIAMLFTAVCGGVGALATFGSVVASVVGLVWPPTSSAAS